MANIPTVIFSYRIDDILEEVTKRTSYFGKMRNNEQGQFMVDRMSLTKGEDFMFSEFLDDAVTETYDWLKAFGKSIPLYNRVVYQYTDMVQYKNYGLAFEDDFGIEMPFNEFVKINTTFTPQVSIDEIDLDHEGFRFTRYKGGATDVKLTYKVVVSSLLDNTLPCVEEIVFDRLENAASVIGPFYKETITFAFMEGGKMHTVTNVDLFVMAEPIPSVPVKVKEGTYVEYRTDFSNDSVFDVYQVSYDCTDADWMDNSRKLAVDPRDHVLYILERKDNMDFNMIPSIDRNIKEALVNYIIHRWFEYVNPSESGAFYAKFEDYAHKAQLGLNSEVKILQRKYNLF